MWFLFGCAHDDGEVPGSEPEVAFEWAGCVERYEEASTADGEPDEVVTTLFGAGGREAAVYVWEGDWWMDDSFRWDEAGCRVLWRTAGDWGWGDFEVVDAYECDEHANALRLESTVMWDDLDYGEGSETRSYRFDNSYDGDDLMAQERIRVIATGEEKPESLNRYAYDDEGHLVLDELWTGGELDSTTTYTWEAGLLVESLYEAAPGGGMQWFSRRRYGYDALGRVDVWEWSTPDRQELSRVEYMDDTPRRTRVELSEDGGATVARYGQSTWTCPP